MALPATHVRYALELMPADMVPETEACIAGTLYPDSRMLTGVSREQTHSEACLTAGFATTPFRCGWQLHCRCDLVQARIHARLWPAAAELADSERWIAMSAAKMVQDEADRVHSPFMKQLDAITPAETPFGESAADITRFYRLIFDVYATAGISPAERFTRLWAGVGLEEGLIVKLIAAYERLTADAPLAKRIAGSMDALLAHRFPQAV